MRRLAVCVSAFTLAFTFAFGCGDDDASPPPPPDTNVMFDATVDSGDAGDTGADVSTDVASDAERDTGPPPSDAVVDTRIPDAPVRDTGLVFPDDTGVPPGDASPDVPGIDACTTLFEGDACPELPATCAPGTTCVDDGCGGQVCVPSSHRCETRADCPSGSDCVEPTAGAEMRCFRASGCGDSRDCSFGFACEAGACVDRRVRCDDPPTPCPQGYRCLDTDFGMDLTCVPAHYKCDSDVACEGLPLFSVCGDIDGDESGECVVETGACTESAMCGDLSCIYDTRFGGMACSNNGLCATAADCGAGYDCVDLWGDGLRQCVQPGTCAATSDCPAPQICAVPFGETSPRCWGEGI